MLATGVALSLAATWVMHLPPARRPWPVFRWPCRPTAFALQMLGERGGLTSRHGRSAFAILLFQDLAVIPILALLPLFSVGHTEVTLLGGIEKTAKVAAVIGGLVIGGHYVLKPVLRVVAATRMQEIFIAMTLLIVVGTATIMEATGISVALGAFVAGVLLADSEYRHELEANVDPFKDLLLGLFFIAVGMSINLGLFASQPGYLLELTLGLVAVKGAILSVLARRHGLSWAASRNLAAYLGQGGEFAFVILSTAVAGHLFVQAEADVLVATVTLSMVLTPFAVQGVAWFNRRRASEDKAPDYETPAESEHPGDHCRLRARGRDHRPHAARQAHRFRRARGQSGASGFRASFRRQGLLRRCLARGHAARCPGRGSEGVRAGDRRRGGLATHRTHGPDAFSASDHRGPRP